jgi:hypothetical protein
MPSRIATFLIDSGFRPVAIAASSNDLDSRASSIKRRCPLTTNLLFEPCQGMSFVIPDKGAKRTISPDAFAVLGPN